MDTAGLACPYALRSFAFERVLDENPSAHCLVVLGTLPDPDPDPDPDSTHETARLPAILRIERTAFPSTFTDHLSEAPASVVASTARIGHTDIYSWWHGWLAPMEDVPDVKITVIFPATEVHVRKHTKQERVMVRETPALYRRIVEPYMNAFPASRTQWYVPVGSSSAIAIRIYARVRDVLEGRAEADAVLCRTPRFLILPDMKWDPTGPVSSLYLLAIAADPALRSLRDLRGGPGGHVAMLEEMRESAYGVVRERWGLTPGALRMYVHYQPSYYHFHVHIVHAARDGSMGMAVGQAHLLDDVVAMLAHSPNILSELTLTYGLGSQHGLYDAMVAAQDISGP